MDDYKGKGFDCTYPQGGGFAVPPFIIQSFSFQTSKGGNSGENDSTPLQYPLSNICSPLDMCSGKNCSGMVTKKAACMGTFHYCLHRLSMTWKAFWHERLQYFQCLVRLWGILNSLMMAFEQDDKVMLTEINLWLFVQWPANTSGCPERAQSCRSQQHALLFFPEASIRDLLVPCYGC